MMDKFIEKKERLEENIKQYKLMIAMREEQNLIMVKTFGSLFRNIGEIYGMEENLHFSKVALRNHLSEMSEIPVEPGKFLELPQDCMDEIMCYFEKCEDFWNLKLVCKAININNRKFKNIAYDYESVMDLNRGKIEMIMSAKKPFYISSGCVKIREGIHEISFEDLKLFRILMRYAKNKKIPTIYWGGKSYEMPKFSMNGKYGSQLINAIDPHFGTNARSFIVALTFDTMGSTYINYVLSAMKDNNITYPVKVGIYSLEWYIVRMALDNGIAFDKYGLIDIKTLVKAINLKKK